MWRLRLGLTHSVRAHLGALQNGILNPQISPSQLFNTVLAQPQCVTAGYYLRVCLCPAAIVLGGRHEG